MRTQSHVCENPRSASILVILVSHNAYHVHTVQTLFSGILFSGIINARLRSYRNMPLPYNLPMALTEVQNINVWTFMNHCIIS